MDRILNKILELSYINKIKNIYLHKQNVKKVNRRMKNLSSMNVQEIQESIRILELDIALNKGVDIFNDNFNLSELNNLSELDRTSINSSLYAINEANNLHEGFEQHNHNHTM